MIKTIDKIGLVSYCIGWLMSLGAWIFFVYQNDMQNMWIALAFIHISSLRISHHSHEINSTL